MEKTRILVVDDEEEICQLTLSFLVRKNYNVLTATNGAVAIDLAKREHPQIVLLDVRLGSESGIEVLKKIKQIDEEIKVIMVTALSDEESAREAESRG